MASFNSDEVRHVGITLLERLHLAGIPAMLAGGAMRELAFGCPHLINDLDIFVYNRPRVSIDVRHALGGYVFKSSCIPYLNLTDVADMVELHAAAPWPVQVVVIRPGVRVLDRLDFGLCQVGLQRGKNGTYSRVSTQAFREDQRNGTLTLTRCDSFKDAQRSMIRAKKILKKYPDYRLVIPEKFKHLIP